MHSSRDEITQRKYTSNIIEKWMRRPGFCDDQGSRVEPGKLMVITQGIGKIKIALKGRYVSRSEMDDYHIIGTAKRRRGAGDLSQMGSQIVLGNPMGMSLKIILVYQAVETGRMPPTVDKASERTSMKGVFCIVKKNRPKREVRSTTRQKITMKWFDEISQWSRGDQFLINSKRAPKPFCMG
jgi:hypothetical protein